MHTKKKAAAIITSQKEMKINQNEKAVCYEEKSQQQQNRKRRNNNNANMQSQTVDKRQLSNKDKFNELMKRDQLNQEKLKILDSQLTGMKYKQKRNQKNELNSKSYTKKMAVRWDNEEILVTAEGAAKVVSKGESDGIQGILKNKVQ